MTQDKIYRVFNAELTKAVARKGWAIMIENGIDGNGQKWKDRIVAVNKKEDCSLDICELKESVADIVAEARKDIAYAEQEIKDWYASKAKEAELKKKWEAEAEQKEARRLEEVRKSLDEAVAEIIASKSL